ncbi:hypothetical protein [Brevibacillus migulae]|uniref:hypothetical protein n=1 Tax=Brevibacillus migulae TaxID=1644114 RepID=UPI00106E8F03|nr:hypothetical protein [Brevibacillus migulae]
MNFKPQQQNARTVQRQTVGQPQNFGAGVPTNVSLGGRTKMTGSVPARDENRVSVQGSQFLKDPGAPSSNMRTQVQPVSPKQVQPPINTDRFRTAQPAQPMVQGRMQTTRPFNDERMVNQPDLLKSQPTNQMRIMPYQPTRPVNDERMTAPGDFMKSQPGGQSRYLPYRPTAPNGGAGAFPGGIPADQMLRQPTDQMRYLPYQPTAPNGNTGIAGGRQMEMPQRNPYIPANGNTGIAGGLQPQVIGNQAAANPQLSQLQQLMQLYRRGQGYNNLSPR